MIRTTFICVILSTLSMGVGCGGGQNPGGSPTVSKADLEHINDQTRIDPANDMGYSKISIRFGELYKEGVVDAQQKEVIAPSIEYLVQDISGAMALLQLERKFLFVPLAEGPYSAEDFADVAGFQYATPYRCGLAMVCVDDRWFYIQEDGTRLSNDTFDWAEPFHLDRAMVKIGERYQIIKPDGSLVKVLPYEQAIGQSPWCWQVSDQVNGTFKSGFVDLDGNPITELIFDNVGNYDPEVKRIRVYKGDRFGFVDEHAKLIIPLKYEYARPFERGTARVTSDGRTFLIDPDGNEVAE